MYRHFTYLKVHLLLAIILLPIILLVSLSSRATLADTQVQSRYDELSNSQGGVATTHQIGFTYTNTSTPVGSVLIQFCDNSPLVGDSCNPPVGMDTSSASLTSQTGNVSFTMISSSGDQFLLSRNPAVPNSTPSTYIFTSVVNPTSAGEYFMRIQTFSSLDGSGPYIEEGGDAFEITSPLTINAIVPPYLTFCGGIVVVNLNCGSTIGNEIDFGDFTSDATSDATSQFVVATNAGNGYNVSVNGETMTSGNYTIPGLIVPTISKVGVSQFGLNVVANSKPAVGANPFGAGGIGVPTPNYDSSNFFTFNNGDAIVSAPTASNFEKFTTSYLVNVSSDQPEGVYITTLEYICLANF